MDRDCARYMLRNLPLVRFVPQAPVIREVSELMFSRQATQDVIGPKLSAAVERQELARFDPEYLHDRLPLPADSFVGRTAVRASNLVQVDQIDHFLAGLQHAAKLVPVNACCDDNHFGLAYDLG